MIACSQYGRQMTTYSLCGIAAGWAALRRQATHTALTWLSGTHQTLLLLHLLYQVGLLTDALQARNAGHCMFS